jgi:hypothetical protein
MRGGRLEKHKEEKQNKFREYLWSMLSEENKYQFNMAWKEQYGDIYEIQTQSNDLVDSTSFNKYDHDYNHYLESFNAVVVSKLRMIIEKRISDESKLTHKFYEMCLYQEITRHLYKYQHLSESGFLELDDSFERLKRLINLGIKSDHYPIFIYGSSITGKTSTLVKFGMCAYKLLEPKNCICIVRFSDLTSQCSTFEGLLSSICEQLSIVQKLNPIIEVKNKDLAQLVDYFHKMAVQISKTSKKNLLILIDGLQDINIEKSLLNKSTLFNNQITWLFHQVLPPKVHVIVSIKRQAINSTSTIVNYNIGNKSDPDSSTVNSKLKNSLSPVLPSANATSSQAAIATAGSPSFSATSGSTVPLFLHYLNEKTSSETENYLFELPIQIKKGDIEKIMAYVKSELIKHDKILSEQQLQTIAQNLVNLKQLDPNVAANQVSSPLLSAHNIMPNQTMSGGGGGGGMGSSGPGNVGDLQTAFLYINFLIKEIAYSSKYNSELKQIFDESTFPKDIDAFMKYKLGN